MSEQVRVLVDALPEVVARWRRAQSGYDRAVHRRNGAESRAERRLQVVLDGMTLRRWRQLIAGGVSIRTSADGGELHRARKLRPAVDEALHALAEVSAVEQARVDAARRELAEATSALLVYGAIAETITGRPLAELRRMTKPGGRPRPRADSGKHI